MTRHDQKSPWLGCIADDYTGASDLASFLVKSGFRTIQINGVPRPDQLERLGNVDAVVIALKSRTIAAKKAVELSRKSLDVLIGIGCKKYYFKYCSTFDSTTKGNIGPVIDALSSHLDLPSTIVCPALPVNGRTVYQGHLFVFDQLLSDSAMKNHPLTPMRESSIISMLESQGAGRAGLLPCSILDKGVKATTSALSSLRQQYQYIVVDSLHEQHLKTIGASVSDFTLITGGSGLAIGLGSEFTAQGGQLSQDQSAVKGIAAPAIVMSGSCSDMTQKQVTEYAKNHPVYSIDVNKLAKREQSTQTICDWLDAVKHNSPLVTASAMPVQVAQNQTKLGAAYVANLIEQTFAEVAIKARDDLGFRNFIVAGGETSGAVVNALSADSFYIGNTIAPGVPMLQTFNERPISLALKSGNFGQTDFFIRALDTLLCC